MSNFPVRCQPCKTPGCYCGGVMVPLTDVTGFLRAKADGLDQADPHRRAAERSYGRQALRHAADQFDSLRSGAPEIPTGPLRPRPLTPATAEARALVHAALDRLLDQAGTEPLMAVAVYAEADERILSWVTALTEHGGKGVHLGVMPEDLVEQLREQAGEQVTIAAIPDRPS